MFLFSLVFNVDSKNIKKISISDSGTLKPDSDLDAETVLVKLQLDTFNS